MLLDMQHIKAANCLPWVVSLLMGGFQEKTMLIVFSFLLCRPKFCVLMPLQLFVTWVLRAMAGIIFIGKEIDDKLANEVIGVLSSPQFAARTVNFPSWASMPGFGTWGCGILRLYLDSEAGMPMTVTATVRRDMILPGQQQAHLLVHQ